MRIVRKSRIEDKRDYWDITIPDNHNFILSNGCIVHNCGTGVGFSVERQYVNKLPEVAEEFYPSGTIIKVDDSKMGWASSFRELISLLYIGKVPSWDLSSIRAAGVPLKTFGGRASGPEPLDRLFKFTVNLFRNAAGRKLNSLECHDLMCTIADVVVSGGVRRSAMISLSNLSDDRMRNAKNGRWWEMDVQRSLANNSVAYTEKPEIGIFMKEWMTLYDSKSGERGIFNRVAARKQAQRTERRKFENVDFGTNPCLTGDTLVAVADGRGHVSFSQLVEEGKDVLVYSMNERGNPVVRWMRNPRVTGCDMDVYELLLDDGTTIKSTNNHKFNLTDGSYKELKDLKPGDSICSMSRSLGSFKDFTNYNKASSKSNYWWVGNESNFKLEHRLSSFILNGGRGLGPNRVVHHIDFNSMNNSLDNLAIMSKKEHNFIHRERMLGRNNPMCDGWFNLLSEKEKDAYRNKKSLEMLGVNNHKYSGITNKQLYEYALELTSKLQRESTSKEWFSFLKDNDINYGASSIFRKDGLGSVREMLSSAAKELGFQVISKSGKGHNRWISSVVDILDNYKLYGYESAELDSEDNLILLKNCERCESPLLLNFSSREICYCEKCSYRLKIEKFSRTAEIKRIKKISDYSRIYNDLKYELNQDPTPEQWYFKCIEKGINITRSWTRSNVFSRVRENALTANHRVISITYYGKENVYNGTVDEFHNFYVGGKEYINQYNKQAFSYVNVHNCGEIILLPSEFCNLSEVVVRMDDSLETLKRKVELATIIGTLQSTLTKFRYLRKIWQKNCEEERLLGVSLTGIMDNPLMSTHGAELAYTLEQLKQHSIEVNKVWAERLGINPSASVTCVKPSGTVSQLVGSGSGMHARYGKFIIRRVRSDMKDPLGQMLYYQGIPGEPDVTKPTDVMVFSFPIKSPETSVFRNDRTAVEQLELYLMYKRHWCEHNPSITIYVKEHEWLEVGAWVYKNFDEVGGVSFLPAEEGKTIYKQAPYQEIDQQEYEDLLSKMPSINWDMLKEYEQEDATESARELSCHAGGCDIL